MEIWYNTADALFHNAIGIKVTRFPDDRYNQYDV